MTVKIILMSMLENQIIVERKNYEDTTNAAKIISDNYFCELQKQQKE